MRHVNMLALDISGIPGRFEELGKGAEEVGQSCPGGNSGANGWFL